MSNEHDFYAKHYPWLNADQRECFDFLCDTCLPSTIAPSRLPSFLHMTA